MRSDKKIRSTMTFFLVFEGLLFYFFVIRRKLVFGGLNTSSIGVAVAFAVLIVVFSPRLRPLYEGILKVSRVMGRITFGFVLILVFFLVLTPLALIKRIIGRPELAVRIEPERESYFEPWTPSEDLRKQY